MFKRLLQVPVAALALVELYALLAEAWWGFELFSHYVVYYLVAALLVSLPLLWKQMTKELIVLSVIIAINLAQVAPYYQSPPAPTTDPTFKVLSHNVQMGNENFDAIEARILQENPDVFTFQETDFAWRTEKDRFSTLYPYIYITDALGPYGIVVASKYPTLFDVISVDRFRIVDASINVDGQTIRVLAVHPPPPNNQPLATDRNRLLDLMGALTKQSDLPTLIMGDMNITPWSPHFKTLLEQGKLNDSRLGFGLSPTWNHELPLFQIPIDHILVSDEFQVHDFKVLAPTGSDHLPVLAELSLP